MHDRCTRLASACAADLGLMCRSPLAVHLHSSITHSLHGLPNKDFHSPPITNSSLHGRPRRARRQLRRQAKRQSTCAELCARTTTVTTLLAHRRTTARSNEVNSQISGPVLHPHAIHNCNHALSTNPEYHPPTTWRCSERNAHLVEASMPGSRQLKCRRHGVGSRKATPLTTGYVPFTHVCPTGLCMFRVQYNPSHTPTLESCRSLRSSDPGSFQ
ncbi:hypothetical protein C8Q74DRAFT_759093 [Fomes fomentarius]|nr:hypothetical protein C8Q74DRAFT_759093 [Fomes fomentarius]